MNTLAACTGGLAAIFLMYFQTKKWDTTEALTGLFYGGGMKVPIAQRIGSAIICVATFASAMAMFAALNAFGLLRVSKQGELIGLDVDRHGTTSYPEHEISGESAHVGMLADMG